MYRKNELKHQFHIDYCFAPVSWLERVNKFEISNYSKCCDISDHVPLFVEFEEHGNSFNVFKDIN
jgi:exonuclease III